MPTRSSAGESQKRIIFQGIISTISLLFAWEDRHLHACMLTCCCKVHTASLCVYGVLLFRERERERDEQGMNIIFA